MEINIYAAWIGMLLGALAGATLGLFFHKKDWMGGYDSWARRLMRLGHISFFGLAFVNIGFALSVEYLGVEKGVYFSSIALIVGAIGMPLICYLSAFIKPIRNLFFIPVVSIASGISVFLWGIFFP